MANAWMTPNPKVGVAHVCGYDLGGDEVIEWQWYYTDSLVSQGTSIPNANGEKFRPTPDLVGKYLGCLVQFAAAGEIDAAPTDPSHQITA